MLRKLALVAASLSLVGGLAACGSPAPDTPPTRFDATSAQDDTPRGAPALTATKPTHIDIKDIAVSAGFSAPVGLDKEGALQVPPLADAKAIAWYKGSPIPGEKPTCTYEKGCVQSATVISHINGNGIPGGFARLSTLSKGDQIEVERDDNRTALFTVYRVQILAKKAFPTDEVYGPTDGGAVELRAITCGPGELETLPDGSRSYKNQTIVYAKFDRMED